MATTQDLMDIKGQMEERVTSLTQLFGNIEHAIEELNQEQSAFDFKMNESLDNDVRDLADTAEQQIGDLADEIDKHFDTELKPAIDKLQEECDTAKSNLSDKLAEQTEGHHGLHDGMVAFGSEMEEVRGNFEQTRNEFLSQVSGLAQTLVDQAEKVFNTHQEVARSVQETQREALNQAHNAFMDLVGGHIENLVPSNFGQAINNLTQGVSDLGDTCDNVSSAFQNEMQTLIQNVMQHAQEGVANEIQQRFQQLMEEAVSFLAQQIMESITMTTVGAGVTGTLSPILPELAVLYKATEAIKEAIKIFKALADVF
jgi:membrane-associated HD superfamily phosphohydrolase